MAAGRVHLRDIRLFTNAGMRFPVCAANAKRLDLDKSGWRTTTALTEATCQACKRVWPNRYPWAVEKKGRTP